MGGTQKCIWFSGDMEKTRKRDGNPSKKRSNVLASLSSVKWALFFSIEESTSILALVGDARLEDMCAQAACDDTKLKCCSASTRMKLIRKFKMLFLPKIGVITKVIK